MIHEALAVKLALFFVIALSSTGKLSHGIELMDEVVSEALKHINRKSKEHTIRVTSGNDFILTHIDAKLIVQVISIWLTTPSNIPLSVQ